MNDKESFYVAQKCNQSEFFSTESFAKMAKFSGTWAACILAAITLLFWGQFVASAEELPSVERASFPEGFVFGTATAAYQVLIKHDSYYLKINLILIFFNRSLKSHQKSWQNNVKKLIP